MKMLIAVTTCHERRAQADAQRYTWAAPANRPWLFKGVEYTDVVFFVGQGKSEREDEVVLDVDDSYAGLPAKVRAVMTWAVDRGYEAVLKLDDDVYLVPSRLPDYSRSDNQYGTIGADYAGNFRMHNGSLYPYDYASGFCYWLSRWGAETIATAPLTEDTMEDRWVGHQLALARTHYYDEKRFCCPYPNGVEHAKYLWGSTIGKQHIAFAQYPPEKLYEMHHWYMVAFVNNRGE